MKENKRMPIVTVRKEDLNKYGPIQPPGWHTFKVLEMDQNGKPGKSNPQNTTFETTFVGVSEKAKGKEVTEYFSTGYLQKMIDCTAACEGVKPEDLFPEGQDEIQIDFSKIVGKQIDLEIQHEVYEGNLQNRIKGFAPAGSHQPF